MHFIVNKSQLVHAIQNVSKAVSSKTTIPILTGIKFEVSKKGLLLTGSDADISIQMFIPSIENDQELVQVIEPGKIVLPRYIFDIVKKLPNNEIEFHYLDSFTVLIKSGSSEFRLNGFDAEEFPSLPQIQEEQIFKIQSDLLKTMIRQTIFAVSTAESRPILTGVLWTLQDQNLKFVSTDSHRLAVREAMVESTENLTFDQIVIPGKSLNELSKIINDDQSLIDIVVTDNQILFKLGHLLFLSRILDGTYPDISRIIPDTAKTKMTIQTKELLDAIERASLISKDAKSNVVKLTTMENLQVEISSNTPEIGKVTEQLQITGLEGDSVKISFNAKYTLDALKAIDSQELVIDFTGALSPFVIKPVDNNKMLYLILPVRTY